MTETIKHAEMRNTVFGEVLAELLEARGLEVTPFKVGKLAEDTGVDGWRVINRMADERNESPGPLGGLVRKLELSQPEIMRLAYAYAFEYWHPAPGA